MQIINLNTPAVAERTYPSFATDDNGTLFLVYRTYAGKDATLWALNLNTDGERVRFDELVHCLVPVGTELNVLV